MKFRSVMTCQLVMPFAAIIAAVFLFMSTTGVYAIKKTTGEALYKYPTGKPVYGGVLRTHNRQQRTFDPHLGAADTLVPNNCYNTLIRLNQKMDGFEMDLAESVHQPDDLTYVFKLRKGVRFHDKSPVNGRELTSADVKYSIERTTGKYEKKGINGCTPTISKINWPPLKHRIDIP